MSFKGQTVIITGAGNGIGQQIAYAYAEAEANVVLADIDEKATTSTLNSIRKNGGRAIFVKTDVRIEDNISNLMETAVNTYNQINILINNAGKGLFKSPYELTIDEWDDLINTNLRSVFLCSREAAKRMKLNESGGSIVNISSTRALMSEPYSEAYAASKGGIVAITHALAASISHDRITVNAISPGWIETVDYASLKPSDHEQHLSKRVGKPADIARACLYLTSKENDFVTGINLIVDGGMTRKMIYEE